MTIFCTLKYTGMWPSEPYAGLCVFIQKHTAENLAKRIFFVMYLFGEMF